MLPLFQNSDGISVFFFLSEIKRAKKGKKSRRGKIKKERETREGTDQWKKKKRLFLHPDWEERKEGMQR